MNKTQSYLLGVGTGVIATLIILMMIFYSFENQMQDYENKLSELQAIVQKNESTMLSTEIYTFQHRSGNTERIKVIENTFNQIDLLKRVNKTLDEAIADGYLIQ